MKRNKLEVIIENFQFLGSRSGGKGGQEGESGGAKSGAGKAASGGEQVDYGDIPF